MSVPTQVVKLVEQFKEESQAVKSPHFKEAWARRDYIDPFFAALGWDVDYQRRGPKVFREVVVEDTLRVEGAIKAPDYCFYTEGTRRFFVEAKKPSVNLLDGRAAAFQVRRYAWSANLPLSILTDFEELAVYDCRIRPVQSDKASTARRLYMTYEEYPDRWDEITSLFSKEAVLSGSLDAFAQDTKKKKGVATVDEAFLREIEGWREMLAKDLAQRNPSLSRRELNYAVQMTIDRIVFLRICEDRGIEDYGTLEGLLDKNNVYDDLRDVFRDADDKYNSGLFHFKREKDREELPDDLTLDLELGDEPLKKIVKSLYYPESPYQFSVMPVEILGQVYEQFLGKVISITPNHQVVIEEKPEVRKAGGVYYTPSYIVDYIVKNTVGKLLEGKTPKQVSKLKVLDPACGSGSFLVGAYSYLLEWHREWYVNDGSDKHAKILYEGPEGEWQLTTAEKKRILLNNIYGVDIDTQAVEVTKLSLLLKVLEGENNETINRQLTFFQERALPDLDNNIKWGNSLIGPDFYENEQMMLLDEEEHYRINVFDWEAAFPQVFAGDNPGFDAVIGNPPYVRPHKLEPHIKEYFWSHYKTFVKKSDLYCCFIERAAALLKRKGNFGFIISNGWLRLDSFEQLRIFLLDQTAVKRIIEFPYNVFEDATVKTAILLFSKEPVIGQMVEVATSQEPLDLPRLRYRHIEQDLFRQTYKSIFDLSLDQSQEIVKKKMRANSSPLSDLFNLSFGLKTGDDSKFLSFVKDNLKHKPLLRGEDVHRYSFAFKGEYVWYDPRAMRAHRTTARPGTAERFEQPKLLIRDTGSRLEGTLDENNYYAKDVLIVSDENKDANKLKALTAILNSRLMRFYYETSFPTLHVQRDELAALPVHTGAFFDSEDESRRARLVQLVERMLALHKQLAEAKISQEKAIIQRQIDATDRQIDRLVYELYGLTEEEIEIVEGQV